MKFSIRDLLLVTALIALAVGWMVDRSQFAWRYDKVVAANERLRELLDKADPGWRSQGQNSRIITRLDQSLSPTAAYATGAVLFGLAVLLIVLTAQGKIDWTLVTRR